MQDYPVAYGTLVTLVIMERVCHGSVNRQGWSAISLETRPSYSLDVLHHHYSKPSMYHITSAASGSE